MFVKMETRFHAGEPIERRDVEFRQEYNVDKVDGDPTDTYNGQPSFDSAWH